MKLRKAVKGIIAASVLLVLILDASTSLKGAQEGLHLCLSTVIPTLFPFIFTSSWLLSALQIGENKLERKLCTIFRCPPGCSVILISGFLGGYPVGARCIGQAVESGQLSEKNAGKMLVYCNAAGPAFLFGILGPGFQQSWIPWILWAIHIFSAFATAWVLPHDAHPNTQTAQNNSVKLTEILKHSVKSISEVCGWIILIRILIVILQKWVLWLLPQTWSIGIIGILELSNGCLNITTLENSGLKFILSAAFLGFGGLCVALQTASAAPGVKQTFYLPGKLIQATISLLIAYFIQLLPFWGGEGVLMPAPFLFVCIATMIGCIYFIRKHEKSCGILEAIGV